MQPFPTTGEKVQLSVAGGSNASWSKDGREVYYRDPSGRLMALPVNSGQAGKPVALFKLSTPPAGERRSYAAMPDGGFLVLKEITPPVPGPVRLVLNWTAALEQ